MLENNTENKKNTGMKPATAYEPFEKMENFMIDVFVKVGVPEPDAKICAEVLI